MLRNIIQGPELGGIPWNDIRNIKQDIVESI
jgi:hypothetical protein